MTDPKTHIVGLPHLHHETQRLLRRTACGKFIDHVVDYRGIVGLRHEELPVSHLPELVTCKQCLRAVGGYRSHRINR
jgi:hypothetical protein